MKILVVEDNPEKLRHVLSALQSGGAADEDIHVAHDAREAKLATESTRYDLMVLDLMIPSHPAASPEQAGGMNLLIELRDRDRFMMPREVVGLTAFSDIKADAAELFGQYMWSILMYDPSTELWFEQLLRKVRHLIIADRSSEAIGYGSHALVLTALPIEFNAVMRLPWKWSEYERPGDVTLYRKGEVQTRGGLKTVYAACAARMGLVSSAALAAKAIEVFRPKYLFMTGIAAGVKGRCELGDVVVAEPSWDWGSGKHSRVNDLERFEPAPHQIAINSALRLQLERLSNQGQLLDAIKREWPGDAPTAPLRLLLGPVASGASVLTDPEKIETIERQHRKLLAIEMEAYGIYSAASESRLPQPYVASMKGISDFADEAKDDSCQKYCAFASASILRSLLEQFL